ncbi:Membrane-bound O-acyltransferase domain-containing protein 2 [Toxocara canis]|uniref:Membrane-bound O-acyltransferase domain-containing protein 2 n=1 Tax=Toxocara canis TaxID=6265 RepID=A0A0B2VIF8_TOXCA|nr:Membrane-bound O-acyltransferase domain-containing protein 2 [Toxocara canis]
MPGVHTFYDGSLVLQPLAVATGIDVDKMNLVVCQFISLPIAFIHYKYMAANRVSRTVRLAFPPAIGIAFCYFCYGNAIKHLLSNIAISFALMHLSPPEYVHKCVFLFSMGYLVFIHWYRWYILTSYSIDITGSMMVA